MTAARAGVQSLDELVAGRMKPLLRRYALSPDYIIGLKGYRGSGKSIGGADIAVRDWGRVGAKLWSNMQLKMVVEVPDAIANNYGLPGGEVVYEAEKIDRHALLSLDSRFEGGLIFLDEINLEYGEARRSSSNVNLSTDTLIQQLRKFRCGLIYTVIDEMFVDLRIRDATDIFVECSDTALYAANIGWHKKQGHDFEWLIYDMTGKMCGTENAYGKTHRAIGPIKRNMRDLWGIIDTFERQASGRVGYTLDLKNSPTVDKNRARWGWLQDIVLSWKASGLRTIEAGELPGLLGKPVTKEIRQWLGVFGVYYSPHIQAYTLSDSLAETERQMVTA